MELLTPNGSSPLTRGTLDGKEYAFEGRRFIPAYAGNSQKGVFQKGGTTVHPRLRGELTATLLCCLVKCGSSPLTRGTRKKARNGKRFDWFIPAYAGNSSIAWMSSMTESVHPRLRGELFLAIKRKDFVVRFIPAYAGNSQP